MMSISIVRRLAIFVVLAASQPLPDDILFAPLGFPAEIDQWHNGEYRRVDDSCGAESAI